MKYAVLNNHWKKLGVTGLWLLLTQVAAWPATVELWQGRNGSANVPTETVAWVKGNAGTANSHYIESQSIPYRLVISDLEAGAHSVIIEWDTKEKNSHAIDFLTHYNRLSPHDVYDSHDIPEAMNPLDGLTGTFGLPMEYAIPVPSTEDSPVSGQPAISFLAIPESERTITAWNTVITNLSYSLEENPSLGTASSRLKIDFVTSEPTAVLAWGGHIATQYDWGPGNAATSISGSPYHMRLVSFDGSSGNQDRSMQATPILPPPPCTITGVETICPDTETTFQANANNFSTAPGVTYEWSITNNTSGATIVGDTQGEFVTIQSGSSGGYEVILTVTVGDMASRCLHPVTVFEYTSIQPLTAQNVCAFSEVTFGAEPEGTGPFTFQWFKDSELLNGQTNVFLNLPEVALTDSGLYGVKVQGACNMAQSEAFLTVKPLPSIVCPPDLTVSCLAEVPSPDVSLVEVVAGAGLVTVIHAGDTLETNDCVVTILRDYVATDECELTTSCRQIITVRDEIAPVMVCAPDKTIECGDEWAFDPPAATDNCGEFAPSVTILSTETNILSPSHLYSVTRTWQAEDLCGNTATCSQTVTLQDTTPPDLTCSENLTVECTDDAGTPATFSITVSDICDPEVSIITSQESGSLFPLGDTVVTVTATDASGNTSECQFTVTVRDTTPPSIICSDNLVVECTDDAGTPVTFSVTASDICDPDVSIVTSSESGSLFPMGDTLVTAVATDASGNTSECQFTVTVQDTTPPILNCPENIVVDCQGPGGTPVTYSAEATDVCDPEVSILITPPSGSLFPLGTTTVSVIATDASGNISECEFTVTVQDLVPPEITCPESRVVSEDIPGGGTALVLFEAPMATDDCTLVPTVVCDPLSGSAFPVGDNVVTCTATDEAGNSTSCTFNIKVVPATIVATSTADSGPGTLRQAIIDANTSPGTNVIIFNFAGEPPYIIELETPLPELGVGVVIDGTSQPGFVFEPVIEVDGTNAIPEVEIPLIGLVLNAGPSVVRGVTLNGFEIGILAAGEGGHVIQGNFIGVNETGQEAVGNQGDGIVIRSPNNLIGGSNPEDGNVISGNEGSGIVLESPAARDNIIQGNFIGLNLQGTTDLGNEEDGIVLNDGAADNLIGGPEPGQGNFIAFNEGRGIVAMPSAAQGNAFLGNSIHANGGLGIDLGNDGVTPNDPGDEDEGPNNLQNYPVDILSFTDQGLTSIEGRLESAAEQPFRIEFFLNQEIDSSGFGEGSQFIGATEVTTDETGISAFNVVLPIAADATQFITATATDTSHNTSEFSGSSPVGSLPFISVQPVGTNLPPGEVYTFCVEAGGSEPLTFQWRRNGANIPGATNQCLVIDPIGLTDGGTYTVVVANRYGAVTSDPAILKLILPQVSAGDDFEESVLLSGFTGTAAGANRGASRQEGEPLHFGKPTSASVWYSWRPRETGIASFKTTGSTFDTILAIYIGDSLTNLLAISSDEDQGGFYTSGVRFNAFRNITYHIVIDGFGEATGDYVFTWDFHPSESLLPIILTQPQNQTVTEGGTATFTVEAISQCRDAHHDCRHFHQDHHDHKDDDDDEYFLTYQWFLNGNPLEGQTNDTLVIEEVDRANLGDYMVEVTDREQSLLSLPANLQINITGDDVQNVQSQDKFLDALLNPNPLRLGGFITPEPPAGAPGTAASGGGSVVRGFTGTQVFNTSRSSTESGEEPVCGVIGGASEWITIVPEVSGVLNLSTMGSSYNTVVAVFRRSVTNAPFLDLIDCNVNASSNVFHSEVSIPVEAGQTNIVVIDGSCAEEPCTLQLNASLIIPATFTFIRQTEDGASEMQISGRPDMNLTVEGTSDFQTWTPLITTNAPTGLFNFVDPESKDRRIRYYRAVILP